MRFLFLFFILISSLQAGAQEIYQGYRNARSMGMGGVAITMVQGAEALFVNPAAMGKNSAIDIHAMGLNLGGRSLSAQDLEDIQALDASDPSTYNNLFGKRIFVDALGSTAFTTPFIGVGYYTDYRLSLELHNPGYPEFTTYFKNDQAYVVGGAYPLGAKSYLGMAFRKLDRWGGDVKELGLTVVADGGDLQSLMNQFSNKGTGYGIDLSFISQVEAPLNPTFALVWQNIGDTSFRKTAGEDAPTHVDQDLSAGVSLGFDLPGIDWVIALEARHLLDSEIQIGKKAHLGTELSLGFIDLRAGLNQGYVTYGVGCDFFIFKLDAVSYTEEIGAYPGQTADNRLMVGLSIDLGFDANFKFTDNNGKKRKLKQRR